MAEIDSTIIEKKRLMFGRYQLLSVLGEGAVGSVYRVYDQETNMELALKVLTNDIPFDNHTLARFKDEYWILKRISHPNLIKAYDLIEQDSQIAYTMEFVDGADLCTLLNSGDINTDLALRIGSDVLSALDTLHGFGLLHRDLKLENVIIDKKGVVKLCDLGLVKSVFKKSMTRTGVLLGTAQYMAPEYIKESEYDARSDVYALGVMLFELLAGKRRLNNLQGNDVVRHLIKTNFLLPFSELQDIDPRIISIVKKATCSDADGRYASAGAFLKDLRSWGDPEIVEEYVKEVAKPIITVPQSAAKVVQPVKVSRKKHYIAYALTVCVILASGIASINVFEEKPLEILPGKYKGKLNIYNSGNYRNVSLVLGAVNRFTSDWKSCLDGKLDLQAKTLKCKVSEFNLSNFIATKQKLSFTVTSKDGKASHRLEADIKN